MSMIIKNRSKTDTSNFQECRDPEPTGAPVKREEDPFAEW
jgi:hypothetical protein